MVTGAPETSAAAPPGAAAAYPAIHTVDLAKRFGDKVALAGLSMTVPRGEVYGNLSNPANGADTNTINLPQLVVARSAAPQATATQVSLTQFEDYILAQPGISDQLKNAIKAIGDPSTTLLIPVPVQYATSAQVTVQGVEGVALGDNTGVGSGVVWVKNGSVYVVAGSIKQSDAIDIANNLK